MIVQIYEVSNPTEARKLVELGVDHIEWKNGVNSIFNPGSTEHIITLYVLGLRGRP